jgi:hypothetical protein
MRATFPRAAFSVGLASFCFLCVGTELGAQLPEWRVEADPAVVIGPGAGSHGEFAFILAAARLADGSVAVVSRGTHDIRVFDGRGRHLRTYGRRGAGPGEYDQPSYVGRAGDTLFIHDFSHRRVSAVHAATGAVQTRMMPPGGDATIYPVVRLGDGTLLAMPLPPTGLRRRDGTERGEIALITIAADASQARSELGTFPWITTLAINPENQERARSVGFYDFGPSLHYTRSRDLIVVGDGAEPRLQYLTARGQRAGEATLPLERRAFDRKVVAAARDKLLAISPEQMRQSVQERHEPRYLPEVQPYFRELFAGPDGEVWVERFRVDRFAAAEFVVIGADRKSVARIALPPGLKPLEVGRDYVLGVATDEDGVEIVVLHRYAR